MSYLRPKQLSMGPRRCRGLVQGVRDSLTPWSAHRSPFDAGMFLVASSIAVTRSRATSSIFPGTTKVPFVWFSVTPLANNHHFDLSGQSQVAGRMPLSIRSCFVFCHFFTAFLYPPAPRWWLYFLFPAFLFACSYFTCASSDSLYYLNSSK